MNTELAPLWAALAASQAEFAAVTRDRQNPQLGNRYVTINAIREMAMPILGRNGIAVIQWHDVTIAQTPMTVTTKSGSYETNHGDVITHTMLVHKDGAQFQAPPILIPWILTNGINRPQAIGIAATYGARYSLVSLLAISGTDKEDTDGDDAPVPRALPHQSAPSYKTPDVADPDAVKKILAQFSEMKTTAEIKAYAHALQSGTCSGLAEDHPIRSAAREAMSASIAVANAARASS